MKRKRHYSPKPKKSELDRKIQSLKDHTDNKLCDLGDQIYELENRLFTLAILLGGVGVIVLALIIGQIISQFTV
ncbi:MAG: hypothetical protein K2H85_06535 [Allobaculum sp.]|nr:hypothetical protein [Allobaculum sp.]